MTNDDPYQLDDPHLDTFFNLQYQYTFSMVNIVLPCSQLNKASLYPNKNNMTPPVHLVNYKAPKWLWLSYSINRLNTAYAAYSAKAVHAVFECWNCSICSCAVFNHCMQFLDSSELLDEMGRFLPFSKSS